MRTGLVGLLAAMVVAGLAAPPGVAAGPGVSTSCATVSVGDADQLEGTGPGTTPFDFAVTVTAPQGCAVRGSVDFATADGDATAPADYVATSGTLTWTGAGPTARTIVVPVVADSVPEPDEQFWVRLSNPVGLTITGGAAAGGIIDDDGFAGAGPTLGVDGSPKCWIVCRVGVHVTGPDPNGLTVQWQTVDDGSAGLGYVPVKDAVLTFPPNTLRADITVQLQSPPHPFQFPVRIFQPSAGHVGNAKAVVTVTPN